MQELLHNCIKSQLWVQYTTLRKFLSSNIECILFSHIERLIQNFTILLVTKTPKAYSNSQPIYMHSFLLQLHPFAETSLLLPHVYSPLVHVQMTIRFLQPSLQRVRQA